MNLFSKIVLSLLLLTSSAVHAININALYLSACKRELGVITGVDDRFVQLIKLDGHVIYVPRYEIIYLAYYPIDILPITKVRGEKGLKLITIKTLHDGKIVNILNGWPIDFSDAKISFLTPDGGEAVINRDSIWGLEVGDTPEEQPFLTPAKDAYEFNHPYSFEYCPLEKTGNINSHEKPRRVYPQQILSDPVMIKKELDRLKKGHEGIKEYDREQDFYAIPQEYGNVTSLGLWLSVGSRYGASSSRTNYTPLLIDEYSSGPFGFQRIFVTGSAPIFESVHEEPQTEMYYRFKADYFHLTAMIDPNLILAGTRYLWQQQDIANDNDDRANEAGFLEMGFDYSHFALNLFMGGGVDIGVRSNSDFVQATVNIPRIGLTYLSHLFKVDAQFGSGGHEAFGMKFFRTNAEIRFIKDFKFIYSFIYRNFTYTPGPTDLHSFQYASTSYTNAIYLNYQVSYKFSVGAFGALEAWSNQYGATSLSFSNKTMYPKGGVYGALSF